MAAKIGNARFPLYLAINRRDLDRLVLAALAAVRELSVGYPFVTSQPVDKQDRDADQFSSQLDLFRNAQRVMDLDTEVTNRAFELCMSQQELNGPEVARLLVNLCSLCPPHRMRAIRRAIEPGALDPGMDDPTILSCRQMRLYQEAAREEVLSIPASDLGKPRAN